MSSSDTKERCFADRVAELCYKHYNHLGKTGKPIPGKEWTLLSSILSYNKNTDALKVLSLATGSKCIGRHAMSPHGDVLNDSHAEVLARRCFLRYLYHNIGIIRNGKESDVLIKVLSQKEIKNEDAGYYKLEQFQVKPDITFHLFSSHVPCGDASIISRDKRKSEHQQLKCDNKKQKLSAKNNDADEHVSVEDDNGDKNVADSKFEDNIEMLDLSESVGYEIYRTGAKCLPNDPRQDNRGSGNDYHKIGAVRTKPGRGDPTLSVSCSDKIARWIAVGIQGALLSLLIEEPIHLSSVIIGKGGPYSYNSLHRALLFRTKTKLAPLLQQSSLMFEMSRYSEANSDAAQPAPSAIIWTDVPDRALQVAVEGRRQGATKKDKRRLVSGVAICKRELFKRFIKVTDNQWLNVPYKDVKCLSCDYENRWNLVKSNLGAWTTKPPDLCNFFISADEMC